MLTCSFGSGDFDGADIWPLSVGSRLAMASSSGVNLVTIMKNRIRKNMQSINGTMFTLSSPIVPDMAQSSLFGLREVKLMLMNGFAVAGVPFFAVIGSWGGAGAGSI